MSSFPSPSCHTHLFGFFDAPLIPAAEVWLAVYDYMERGGVAKKNYTLNPGIGKRRGYRERYLDRKLTAHEIAEELAKDDDNGFTIKHSVRGEVIPIQDFRFSSAPNQRKGFQQLSIKTGTVEETLQDWSPLVDRLVVLEISCGWATPALPTLHGRTVRFLKPIRDSSVVSPISRPMNFMVILL